MPKGTAFHGILAVGRSKTDAVNQYRLLAMGKGAVAQVSGERDLAFITQASHAEQMFNPLTGNMDLESDSSMLEKFEFASNSSADVEVNHLVCESGCGVHVVYDSESLVKYCPQCTSPLSAHASDDEDGEGEDESDEDESDVEDLGDADAESDSEDCESGDDEEDEDEGEDDSDEESDDEEESDDDSTVVVSSSFEEAMQVFASNKEMESRSSDEQLRVQYVVCSSDECKVHILSDKVMSECPVCQSSVEEPAEAPVGVVDLATEETGESTSEDEVPGDTEGGEDEDTGSDDTSDADDESSEDEDAGEGEGEEEAGEADASADEEGEDKTNALTVLDDQSTDAEDSSEEDEDEGEDDELSEDSEEISADSDMDESASADQLDVSYSSSVGGNAAWTAYHKGVPVAMARKATAGKNADIFDTPSFGHAVLASAKVVGVKKALVELGFDTIKHKVSVSKEVRRMVDAQVAEQRAALSSEISGFQERFAAALATAAIGINRGFFADVKNPLKESLWNAMSSAGIRNPEVLIDNAFRAHGDAYHKVLFAQANDIAAKPAEVQESLSKTILGTNYQAVSSEQPGTSVEDRLAGMGTSVSTEQKPGAGAAVSTSSEVDVVGMQKIHRAVSSLGRRGR